MKDSAQPLQNHHDQLSTLAQNKAFLGREFLTWLWYFTETAKDKLRLPLPLPKSPTHTISLWIDDRIVLQALDQRGHEHLMRGGAPSHSEEAATALARGQLVKELKLGVLIDGIGEFTAILSYQDLNPRSLHLPPALEEEVPDDDESHLVGARLFQTQCFLAVLDGLFAVFLRERTDAEWETQELPKIRQWMKNRRRKGKTAILH